MTLYHLTFQYQAQSTAPDLAVFQQDKDLKHSGRAVETMFSQPDVPQCTCKCDQELSTVTVE